MTKHPQSYTENINCASNLISIVDENKKEHVKKEITPTFNQEFALKTNKFQNRKLAIKFRALRELYNCVLAEIIARTKAMKQDPLYTQALLLYKIEKETTKKTKEKDNNTDSVSIENEEPILKSKSIFEQLQKEYLLKKSNLQTFATRIKNSSYMKDHLDGDTIQVISDRAYDAYNAYKFKKKGKPRFKSWKFGLRSISGKKNACVCYTKESKIKWKDLLIDIKFDKKDIHGVEAHALNSKLKYCRILMKTIRGEERYFVQLVLEGIPLVKAKNIFPDATIGIDIGVSTIAVVSDKKALLQPFCHDLKTVNNEVKKIQHKMARSQRLNNPDNYEPTKYTNGVKKKGKNIKGKNVWKNSKRYLALKSEAKELYRVQADKRKMLHNILANEVLSLGKNVKIEDNNYKAWQKGWFGRTIGFRAPSMFVEILTRKALSAGGKVEFIDTWTSKLSQYCHVCNGYHKKLLSQRTHTCKKITVQRDLYSALLAQYYDLGVGKVNRKLILRNWTSLDKILCDALLTCGKQFQSVKVGAYAPTPTSLGF